jgi:hypothetical protein
MSSGSWLTLHNCEISYLSAVHYGPAIAELFSLSGSLFTLPPYPKILAEVTIYPARFTAFFGLYQDHYFTLGPWAFGMIYQVKYTSYSMQVWRFFKEKILSYLFLNQGHF